MTVTFKDGAATMRFDLAVTTAVVSHDPSKNTDTGRWQKTGDTRTHPTQFPNGTHVATGSGKTSDAKFGDVWLKTGASQMLPGENEKEVSDAGYFIHLTPYSNTNGCVGILSKEDMDILLNLFEANKDTTDNRTLLIITGDLTE
jgi:hypothetical protein